VCIVQPTVPGPYLHIQATTDSPPPSQYKYTEPSAYLFNYTLGDAIILPPSPTTSSAATPLVWHSQLPAWLTAVNWTSVDLVERMENHLNHVITHYADRCCAWDVVNEAFNEDGTLRSTIWLGYDWL
jgi:endo-1,4-beta-xylanase